MTATPEQLKEIKQELDRSRSLPAYEAIDAAWLALLKSANTMRGNDEHERIASLLEQLPNDQIRLMLSCAAHLPLRGVHVRNQIRESKNIFSGPILFGV